MQKVKPQGADCQRILHKMCHKEIESLLDDLILSPSSVPSQSEQSCQKVSINQ